VAVVMIPVCLARTVMFDVASFSVVSIFLAWQRLVWCACGWFPKLSIIWLFKTISYFRLQLEVV
jgi:hypothetical protein